MGGVKGQAGVVIIHLAFFLIVLLGFVGLAIDVAHLCAVRTKLQNCADASALAAVAELPNQSDVESVAQTYAVLNYPDHGVVLAASDVAVGHWDQATRVFDPEGTPVNATQVTTRRSTANDNPLDLMLLRILGPQTANVSATAVAARGGAATRFLIDEELIDTDIPVLEKLANDMGVPVDRMISDMDGDWFIDLPPGVRVELPTGQLGDEGLMDIDHPEFPFSQDTKPSHADFLNYNEDSGSWRYKLVPKKMLDPLYGVTPVNQPSKYYDYVSGSFVHVSPVYKGDISYLGSRRVNALGLRRGLLAFKIVAVGVDPDGKGSKLPNLVFEIVDPSGIDIEQVGTPESAGSMVRLVR